MPSSSHATPAVDGSDPSRAPVEKDSTLITLSMKRSNLLTATLPIAVALRCAAALGAPLETPGIGRTIRVSRYPKALGLAALVALVFASTCLQAQLVNPSPPRLSEARPTQPVITCTVGSAGFLGNAGRQAGTIEMVVALGVTYVVLGGVLFALVASFRLLGDKVDSFFAPLIPKTTGARVSRTIPPLDEDFSPFKFEPQSEPCAKQEASR